MRKILHFLTLLKESTRLSFESVFGNKLRSLLSILGITIGIFCIILVLSIVDSLEENIKKSIESMGSDVVFVNKWPWEFSGDYPWWEYMNREVPTYEEYKFISSKKSDETIQSICYLLQTGNNLVEYNSYSASNVGVFGITYDFNNLQEVIMEQGRYFNLMEVENGGAVAIIGSDIAKNLFGDENPIGKKFKVNKRKVTVLGVVKKEGENALGKSLDEKVLIPYTLIKRMVKMDKYWANSSIMVKAQKGMPLENMELELKHLMRAKRKITTGEKNSFALNKLTMLTNQLSMFFVPVNIAGSIIGGFSILVGCFGVANIMFVSVRERTNIIGIQKALGAKKFFILIQFLIESIILCVLGGLLGITMVYLILQLGNMMLGNMDIGMELFMDTRNFIVGLTISISIGIISGIIPAIMASNLDAVEAIRS